MNFSNGSPECIILAQMFVGLQYWEIVNPFIYPYKKYKQDYYNTVGPKHSLDDPLKYHQWFKKQRASV